MNPVVSPAAAASQTSTNSNSIEIPPCTRNRASEHDRQLAGDEQPDEGSRLEVREHGDERVGPVAEHRREARERVVDARQRVEPEAVAGEHHDGEHAGRTRGTAERAPPKRKDDEEGEG